MSNMSKDISYNSFEQAIEFILEENLKKMWVSLPAIVQSYDSLTKRCTILPAIKRMFTDDTYKSLPTISNVPVISPSGSGYSVTISLKKGDAVMVSFSQRGLANFKESFKESLPTYSLFDLNDAVIIGGFGNLSITPATTDGISIQNDDATKSIVVENNQVNIKNNNNSITLKENNIELNVDGSKLTLTKEKIVSSVAIEAPNITIGGISMVDHTHIGYNNTPTSGPQ
jgi:hypothetical protein